MFEPGKLDIATQQNEPLSQDRQDLWDAAQYLKKYGHCKGMLRDGERRCWEGAILEVTGLTYAMTFDQNSRSALAFKRWQEVIGMEPLHTVHWNDHPGTTAEQVIQKLEYAALA